MGGRLAVGISVMWVALAFLGDGLTTLVLPSLLAEGPGAATAIGLISFVGLGLAVAAQPIAGWLSDRLRGVLDRRAFISLAGVPALVGLTVLATADTIALVAAGYFAVMVAASAIQAGQQTLIPEHIQSQRRGLAAGIKTAFDIGGAFVAFLVLGLALESGGVPAAAAATGIFVIVAVVILMRWVPPSIRDEPAWAAMGGGLPPGLWTLILSRFLFLLGIYAVGRFLLLLVAERMGIPPGSAAAETAALLGSFTLMTAVSALALGPLVDRAGRAKLMITGAVIAAAGTGLFVLSAGLPGILVAGALMSLGTAGFATANWAAMTDISPAPYAGRLLGVANVGTGGAAAVAGLIGPSIDAWGFSPALIGATIAILAAIVPVAWRPSPQLKESAT